MGIELHRRCTPWVVRSQQRTCRHIMTFGLHLGTLQQIKECKSRLANQRMQKPPATALVSGQTTLHPLPIAWMPHTEIHFYNK